MAGMRDNTGMLVAASGMRIQVLEGTILCGLNGNNRTYSDDGICEPLAGWLAARMLMAGSPLAQIPQYNYPA